MTVRVPAGDEADLALLPATPEDAVFVGECRRAARAAGARNLYAARAAVGDAAGLLLVCNVRGRPVQVADAAVSAVRTVVAAHDRVDVRVVASSTLTTERHMAVARADARGQQQPAYPFTTGETWVVALTLVGFAALTLWSPLLGWVLLAGWVVVTLAVAARRGSRIPGVPERGSGRPVGWAALLFFAAFVFAAWWGLLRSR